MAREIRFQATERYGDVTGLIERPRGAKALYVLGHGAGAGMRHAFMEDITARLAERKVATFRYDFPYMERGLKRPDHGRTLREAVRAAVAEAQRRVRGLPVFAGGKSMGGRMTSLAASEAPLDGVQGLVFLGFPLHPAGKPSTDRAPHLADVDVPMLFIQGTRDKLAELALLRPVVKGLGQRAKLHIVDGGDHSFHVLKRSGRDPDDVMDEIAGVVTRFTI